MRNVGELESRCYSIVPGICTPESHLKASNGDVCPEWRFVGAVRVTGLKFGTEIPLHTRVVRSMLQRIWMDSGGTCDSQLL
jgi:hypothetical protein